MEWNHLIFEGFCTRTITTKKHKYHYEIISIEPWKTEKVPNPDYDPSYRTPRKPRYCQNKICFVCWEKNCPHLVMCPVDEETYEMFMKAWSKWSDENVDVKKHFIINGRKYKALIKKDDELYVVTEPKTGCTTQGETIEIAMKNIEEAVRLYLENK